MTRRVVRSVEIRERMAFDKAVRSFMEGIVDGQAIDPEDHAKAAFGHLQAEEIAILTESFKSVVESLNEANGIAYGASRDLVDAYVAASGRKTSY